MSISKVTSICSDEKVINGLEWDDAKFDDERTYKSANMDWEPTFTPDIRLSHSKPQSAIKNFELSSSITAKIKPVTEEPKPIKRKEDLKANIFVEKIVVNKDVVIRKLDKFYSAPNSIAFVFPIELLGKIEMCEVFVKKTVQDVYRKFQGLSPLLTFKPSSTDLKCKGSFSHGYTVCYFSAQVWRLDPQISKSQNPDTDFIWEFKRESLDGRSAFEKLLSGVASWLLEDGKAKTFCSGLSIYPPAEPLEALVKEHFLNRPKPTLTAKLERDNPCSINLDADLVSNWVETIAQRWFPSCMELIRILALCSKDENNLDVMAEDHKLLESICKELRIGVNPSVCLNCLIIVRSILDVKDVEATDCLMKQGIIEATTKTLLMHSGQIEEPTNKRIGRKGKRINSASIELAALQVLKALLEYPKIEETYVKGALQMLEQDLSGILKDKENNSLLQEVIKQLKNLKERREMIVCLPGTMV